MIQFLYNPPRHSHTNRSYLTQWFHQPTLVVTDVDINEESNLKSMIEQHPCQNVVVDLSHNAMPENDIPDFLRQYTTLTTMYYNWYQPYSSNTFYFPLWMWMFNRRSNQFFSPVIFDAPGAKTLPMMCLNRNMHPHRIRFRELIASIEDCIMCSFGRNVTLPGDSIHEGLPKIDIGVGHPVYSQCAVNIVTETVLDRGSLSEKSCKPFVARQIPVIVGPEGANQFLQDLGFDMFSDLVPWSEWDQEPDVEIKLQRIADFVCDWYHSGHILDQYRSVQHRVEHNKQHIHSESFLRSALRWMPNTDPYLV
jgi:hypothetical protein